MNLRVGAPPTPPPTSLVLVTGVRKRHKGTTGAVTVLLIVNWRKKPPIQKTPVHNWHRITGLEHRGASQGFAFEGEAKLHCCLILSSLLENWTSLWHLACYWAGFLCGEGAEAPSQDTWNLMPAPIWQLASLLGPYKLGLVWGNNCARRSKPGWVKLIFQ